MFWVAKIAGWLALPPGVFLLLALGALALLWRRRRRAAAIVLGVFTATLYLLSIEPVADALLRPLEERHPDPGAAVSRCEAIAVLGAGLSERTDPAGRPRLSRSSTLRALAAYRLWRRLHVPLVLSGGEVWADDADEAGALAGFLFDLGLPAADLILERESRNTYENGRAIRAVAERHGWRTLCLVTSAVHLPRAVRVFVHFGMNPVPVPADYLSGTAGYGVQSFFPRGGDLAAGSAALHEYLGLAYYAWYYGT